MRATGAVQPVEDFVEKMDAAHKFYSFAVAPYKYDGHIWAIPMWKCLIISGTAKALLKKPALQCLLHGTNGWLQRETYQWNPIWHWITW
jgi:multiple sugar transport system substrate-binding protein